MLLSNLPGRFVGQGKLVSLPRYYMFSLHLLYLMSTYFGCILVNANNIGKRTTVETDLTIPLQSVQIHRTVKVIIILLL